MGQGGKDRNRAQELIDQAFTWLQDPKNAFWVQETAREFFPSDYPAWANEWLASLFPVWLMFDYKDRAGRTGLYKFREAMAGSISGNDEKILDRMLAERFRLVKVMGCKKGRSIRFADLVSGEVFDVVEEKASAKLKAEDLCFVRLRRLPGVTGIDTLAFVPAQHKDSLLLSIASAVDSYRQHDPGFTEERLFQEQAPEVFRMALDLAINKPGPTNIQDLPEKEQDILKAAVKDHFERWLDTPQVGLDGKTPRQASVEPGLKDELKRLLEEVEQRSDSTPWLSSYMIELRGKLGL
ncbi:MAG: hypothetical protein GXP49_17270 [Deltaproteobacteria bacterium]|nr:hypothetical protein [Deltaproteobacteria bacterium]